MKSAVISAVIVRQVLTEQLKNRFFQLILIFGAVLIYAALLLGAMADEQEARVLKDFGLGLIELVGLASVIFGCASALLRDMETKNIYLVLSRPVPRWAYVVGQYCGLVSSVGVAIAIMGTALWLLLLLKGYAAGADYAAVLLAAWLKTAVIGALAVLVSLVSTSVLSAVIISTVFWTTGHFIAEARFISERFGGAASLALKPLLYIVPNMGIFNLKDGLNAAAPDFAGWPAVFGYATVYCGVCIALSAALFSKKEF